MVSDQFVIVGVLQETQTQITQKEISYLFFFFTFRFLSLKGKLCDWREGGNKFV